MENTPDLDYFWQKIEVADSFFDRDDAQMTRLLQNCLDELAVHSGILKNSDYHHLKGYSYYSMRPQKLAEAKTEFEEALKLDSSNSYSKLYLGHTYYDQGDYQNAQKQFSDIPENGLPDWLMMKADEMIVCCKFHMSPNTAEQDIQIFLEKYASSYYLDDYPFELSKLLKQKGREPDNEESKYRNG